jgi:hypothetical protein
MKIYDLFKITTIGFLVILMIFSGCSCNSQENRQTYLPSDESNTTQTKTSSQPNGMTLSQPTLLSAKIAQAPILKEGLTLENISKYLNQSEEELKKEYGDNIKLYRWDLENSDYREYLKSDSGLILGCCPNTDANNYKVNYIELERDKISFNNINKDTNFEEVKKILGEAEVCKIEDGLPGLLTYELRYQYNGIDLRIYSWDKSGNGGINISVVDDFLPKYRDINVTCDQINQYFGMKRERLEVAINKGETSMSYDGKYQYIDYPNYGVSFEFDKEGLILNSMHFSSNYEINGLKQGFSIEKAMAIMGAREVEEIMSEESGSSHFIRYEYKNFTLIVRCDDEYSDGTYWQIERR